jgi:endonuclease/exonuclease/phosphatase family metal-dependent hydrolase
MDPMRAMSFNVRYDTADDGPLAWPNRRELVAGVVRYHAPDLVGLQEPLDHQFAYLRERLPAYDWYGVGRVDGAADGEFTPIGVRSDRFQLGATGTRWLSESPETPGSVDADARFPRIVSWAAVTDRPTGRRLYLFNTHFDHRSAAARRRGATRVRRTVADVAGDDPALVTGDLNATPESPPLARFRDPDGPGRPFRDARALAAHHHGPSHTFRQFEGDPTERIDYVLVGDEDWTVAQHAVLADRGDDLVPSDHRPVVAELTPPDP